MHKESLLIIIDNLQKGGAEVLLVGILAELNEKYDVTIVTLTGECDFGEDEIICSKRYVLGFKGKKTFFPCIFKLRKIIKNVNPSFVHAHLFYSSLIARVACPAHIRLYYSIHNELSKNIFNANKLLKWMEGASIRKNHAVIAVSDLVLLDYKKSFSKPEKSFVLKNYIGDRFLNLPAPEKNFNALKEFNIISIGNIKQSKNYSYLVQSMIHLKDYPVTLDIYGKKEHELFAELNKVVEENNLPVHFKGTTDNVLALLKEYDLYVMSSIYEGFGISTVEAMACGLPLLLSKIPVFEEVTYNNAIFFDIEDPMAFADLIKKIFNNEFDLNANAAAGIAIANKYNRQNYIGELFSIYDTKWHTLR